MKRSHKGVSFVILGAMILALAIALATLAIVWALTANPNTALLFTSGMLLSLAAWLFTEGLRNYKNLNKKVVIGEREIRATVRGYELLYRISESSRIIEIICFENKSELWRTRFGTSENKTFPYWLAGITEGTLLESLFTPQFEYNSSVARFMDLAKSHGNELTHDEFLKLISAKNQSYEEFCTLTSRIMKEHKKLQDSTLQKEATVTDYLTSQKAAAAYLVEAVIPNLLKGC